MDDGSKFTVTEKNVPENHTVSISKNLRKYIIVNTKEEMNPKTLDNIYLYLILFLGSFVGVLVSFVAFRKFEVNE